jgi:tRNA (adenine57-N1/adenine58-N1)-methyltransferase
MAKILFRKGKREFIPELDKEVTIVRQKEFFVSDTSNDYHTDKGVISKADLKKIGKVQSNRGADFYAFEPSFIDLYKRIKRIAQIIPRKDVGFIITEAGIGKKSVILDAGSGSGGLSLFLANIAKKVITYDIKQEHVDLVNHNVKQLGLKNIKSIKHDIYTGIKEKNIDVITLDLPEPWLVLNHAAKALKPGGFVVSYSPCIPQVADLVNTAVKMEEFVHIMTVELMEREWEVSDRKVRPKSKMMGHSGFLTFLRRI